uniref:Uncharacterized protein n=1 Tax=Setaria italica TaxID=4555 RepID=K3ZGQ8_SETIT
MAPPRSRWVEVGQGLDDELQGDLGRRQLHGCWAAAERSRARRRVPVGPQLGLLRPGALPLRRQCAGAQNVAHRSL